MLHLCAPLADCNGGKEKSTGTLCLHAHKCDAAGHEVIGCPNKVAYMGRQQKWRKYSTVGVHVIHCLLVNPEAHKRTHYQSPNRLSIKNETTLAGGQTHQVPHNMQQNIHGSYSFRTV